MEQAQMFELIRDFYVFAKSARSFKIMTDVAVEDRLITLILKAKVVKRHYKTLGVTISASKAKKFRLHIPKLTYGGVEAFSISKEGEIVKIGEFHKDNICEGENIIAYRSDKYDDLIEIYRIGVLLPVAHILSHGNMVSGSFKNGVPLNIKVLILGLALQKFIQSMEIITEVYASSTKCFACKRENADHTKYGVPACEMCAECFEEYSSLNIQLFVCNHNQDSPFNTYAVCDDCRFQLCVQAGMVKEEDHIVPQCVTCSRQDSAQVPLSRYYGLRSCPMCATIYKQYIDSNKNFPQCTGIYEDCFPRKTNTITECDYHILKNCLEAGMKEIDNNFISKLCDVCKQTKGVRMIDHVMICRACDLFWREWNKSKTLPADCEYTGNCDEDYVLDCACCRLRMLKRLSVDYAFSERTYVPAVPCTNAILQEAQNKIQQPINVVIPAFPGVQTCTVCDVDARVLYRKHVAPACKMCQNRFADHVNQVPPPECNHAVLDSNCLSCMLSHSLGVGMQERTYPIISCMACSAEASSSIQLERYYGVRTCGECKRVFGVFCHTNSAPPCLGVVTDCRNNDHGPSCDSHRLELCQRAGMIALDDIKISGMCELCTSTEEVRDAEFFIRWCKKCSGALNMWKNSQRIYECIKSQPGQCVGQDITKCWFCRLNKAVYLGLEMTRPDPVRRTFAAMPPVDVRIAVLPPWNKRCPACNRFSRCGYAMYGLAVCNSCQTKFTNHLRGANQPDCTHNSLNSPTDGCLSCILKRCLSFGMQAQPDQILRCMACSAAASRSVLLLRSHGVRACSRCALVFAEFHKPSPQPPCKQDAIECAPGGEGPSCEFHRLKLCEDAGMTEADTHAEQNICEVCGRTEVGKFSNAFFIVKCDTCFRTLKRYRDHHKAVCCVKMNPGKCVGADITKCTFCHYNKCVFLGLTATILMLP